MADGGAQRREGLGHTGADDDVIPLPIRGRRHSTASEHDEED